MPVPTAGQRRRILVPLPVEVVVQGLQADPELFGRFGLVAAMAIERVVDRLHLQIAQRNGSGDSHLGRRAPATGESLWQMVGRDRAARRVSRRSIGNTLFSPVPKTMAARKATFRVPGVTGVEAI